MDNFRIFSFNLFIFRSTLEMESAPRNVQVRPLSSSMMMITWEPPETPNGQVTVSWQHCWHWTTLNFLMNRHTLQIYRFPSNVCSSIRMIEQSFSPRLQKAKAIFTLISVACFARKSQTKQKKMRMMWKHRLNNRCRLNHSTVHSESCDKSQDTRHRDGDGDIECNIGLL